MAKRYGPVRPMGEKPLRAGMPGHKGPLRFSLRVGEIKRVDNESMVCDIAWLQGRFPDSLEVPLTSPYWSPRGFMGVMPEEGALVVCGFSAVHGTQGSRPYILSFLPSGYRTALGFQPFGLAERNAPELNAPLEDVQRELDGQYGPTRFKYRKLYSGDAYISSPHGGELIVNRDVHAFDASGGELWLRGEDSSLTMTTLDHYLTTGAGRTRHGRITRSALTLPADVTIGENGRIPLDSPLFKLFLDAGVVFADGSLAPDINALPFLTLESGERLTLVTENGIDPARPDARVYTESRQEIQEFSDQMLGQPDHYGLDTDLLSPETRFTPFIESVKGTLVGNDPYTLRGRRQYGQLLRPKVFDSPTATTGNPGLSLVDNDAEETEQSLVGAGLYRMRRPDGLGELFVAHDKEGHVFLSIPGSSSKPSNLGGNRSVEADLKGSLKVVLGANTNDTQSMDLFARGGFLWSLGTLASSRRSLDMRMQGGVHLKVQRPDVNGYAYKAVLVGDMGHAIDGSLGLTITGDRLEETQGLHEMNAEAVSSNIGAGGKTETVQGDRQSVITGSEQLKINQGRDVTITSPGPTSPHADRLEILTGTRLQTFAAPTTDTIRYQSAATRRIQATGALSASWSSGGVGSYSFSATAGTFSVNMGTGAISMNTSGAVSITAGASISLTAATINLTGSVGLGAGAAAPNAVVGGVPGPSPYIDPISGIPATGNPLVRTV